MICFMACLSVPHSQILLGSTILISQNMVKKYIAMPNGKTVLHNVINLCVCVCVCVLCVVCVCDVCVCMTFSKKKRRKDKTTIK